MGGFGHRKERWSLWECIVETDCIISVFETIELMWWYLIFVCSSCVCEPPQGSTSVGFLSTIWMHDEIHTNDLLSFHLSNMFIETAILIIRYCDTNQGVLCCLVSSGDFTTMELMSSSDSQSFNSTFSCLHHRMTKCDVKNYLEKIYNVPVGTVRTRIQFGECCHCQPQSHTV